MNNSFYPKGLLFLEIVFLILTGLFNQAGWGIWGLEVFPAVLGTVFFVVSYSRFRFSNLVYTLLFLHTLILMYGGMYTYAATPLGFWFGEIFGWTRNNYDKFGHFMQGFTPVLALREYFIRKSMVKSRTWLPWILVFMILGTAAFYEFIEWWIALIAGETGDAFLGTQGYIFDTQSDMLLCLIGSVTALVIFSRVQDKLLKRDLVP